MLYVLNKGAHAVTALGQDRWIFAKLFFFFSVYGSRRSRGTIFSHLDQTSLVNKGFTDLYYMTSSSASGK